MAHMKNVNFPRLVLGVECTKLDQVWGRHKAIISVYKFLQGFR